MMRQPHAPAEVVLDITEATPAAFWPPAPKPPVQVETPVEFSLPEFEAEAFEAARSGNHAFLEHVLHKSSAQLLKKELEKDELTKQLLEVGRREMALNSRAGFLQTRLQEIETLQANGGVRSEFDRNYEKEIAYQLAAQRDREKAHQLKFMDGKEVWTSQEDIESSVSLVRVTLVQEKKRFVKESSIEKIMAKQAQLLLEEQNLLTKEFNEVSERILVVIDEKNAINGKYQSIRDNEVSERNLWVKHFMEAYQANPSIFPARYAELAKNPRRFKEYLNQAAAGRLKVETLDQTGTCLLSHALAMPQVETVKFLLARGAATTLYIPNFAGETAYQIAIGHKNTALMDLFGDHLAPGQGDYEVMLRMKHDDDGLELAKEVERNLIADLAAFVSTCQKRLFLTRTEKEFLNHVSVSAIPLAQHVGSWAFLVSSLGREMQKVKPTLLHSNSVYHALQTEMNKFDLVVQFQRAKAGSSTSASRPLSPKH